MFKQNFLSSLFFIVLLLVAFLFIFSDGIPMLETVPEDEVDEEIEDVKEVDLTEDYLKQGYNIYRGSAEGYGGEMVIDVVFNNGEIIDIIIVKDSETDRIAEPAFEQLIEDMLEKQSPDVDIVTGATDTSKALMEAVEKALEQK